MANGFAMLRKYGGERKAAIMYEEETGGNWNDLEPDEKQMWIAKAYQREQDKQTTQPVGR